MNSGQLPPITWDDVRDMDPPQATLYFGLAEQTVDALHRTLEALRQVRENPLSWKWAVIGMHAALQGSFGLVLRRSDGAQLLIRQQEKQFLQRVERERANHEPEAPIYWRFEHGEGFAWCTKVRKKGDKIAPPYRRRFERVKVRTLKEVDRQVDRFLELFKKTKRADRMDYLGGVPLKPSTAQSQAVQRLNRHRNEFIHFSDVTFVTLVSTHIEDISHGLEIVDTLLNKTQAAGVPPYQPIPTINDWELSDRAVDIIDELRQELLKLKAA